MKNAFTVDLEDWFCSHNLKGTINNEDWDTLPGRVVKPTMDILQLLGKHKCKATFFVLGWIADRYPELIQIIAREGHEIASHGYAHELLTGMTRNQFEDDLRKSVNSIYSASGILPTGFRAPAFTVVKSTLWALDVLKNNGFTYDSSIYPTGVHPDYGMANAPLAIHQMNEAVVEVPLSCAVLYGQNIPCSGGAYLRFLPYPIYKILVRQVVDSGRNFIFYIHPWEIDVNMPRVKLPVLKGLRHYTNLSSTMGKMDLLLQDFEFSSIKEILNDRARVNGVNFQKYG